MLSVSNKTRLSSIVSQPIKVVVDVVVDVDVVVVFIVVVVVMAVVDPRNLPLKSGQNRVSNSGDFAVIVVDDDVVVVVVVVVVDLRNITLTFG